MQLVDRVIKKLSKESMSVLTMAKQTGISAYKIYKWLDGKGKPKAEDAAVLEQWLNDNLDKFPNGADLVMVKDNTVYLGEAKSYTVQDLMAEKEARRKEAEERAKRAEEQNDRLMALLESNLNMLHTEVRVGLAYQKAWVEYEAEKAAQGDEKKQQEVLDKMGRLVRSKIKVDPKTDNAASGRT